MEGLLSLESLGSPIQASRGSSAKLKHLCPEDKARIGELVRRLAIEKKERAKLERELNAVKKELQGTERDRQRLSQELSMARQQLTETQSVLSSYKFSSPQSTNRISLTSSSEKKNCSVQTASDKEVQTEVAKEGPSPKPKRVIDEMKDLHKEISSLGQSVKGIALQSSVRNSQTLELPRQLSSPDMSNPKATKQNLFLTSLKDPILLESLSKYQRSAFQADDLSSPRYNPLITPRTAEGNSLRIPDDKSSYFSDSLFRLVDELEAQPTARWPEGSLTS